MADTRSTVKGEARALILNAAEELFARHGVDAVSLRNINAAAGVSAGVLHYHFGSREALVMELINRHMGELMAERQQRLQALAAQAEVSVREIVSVLVEPLAELTQRQPEQGARYVQFMARLYADNSPLLVEASERYREVNALYPLLLARALPDRDPLELQQRLAMANHTQLQTLADLVGRERAWISGSRISGGAAETGQQARVELLIDFISAGMQGDSR